MHPCHLSVTLLLSENKAAVSMKLNKSALRHPATMLSWTPPGLDETLVGVHIGQRLIFDRSRTIRKKAALRMDTGSPGFHHVRKTACFDAAPRSNDSFKLTSCRRCDSGWARCRGSMAS